MRVTYWNHSGFSVETKSAVLLFDYIGGGFTFGKKPVLAMISHAHGDHRKPELIASAMGIIDCPKVGETFTINGVKVRTFGSTDEGVSFLAEVDGYRIFHAGDLNLWHWRNENDPEWTKQAAEDFERVMDTLSGEKIDLAMFPVDPRMGEGYDEGACIFNERMKPGVFIPMHFWDHPEASTAFAEKYDNVRPLTKSGEYIEI